MSQREKSPFTPDCYATVAERLAAAMLADAWRFEEVMHIYLSGGRIEYNRERLEWTIHRPDGGRSWVQGSLATILDDGIEARRNREKESG